MTDNKPDAKRLLPTDAECMEAIKLIDKLSSLVEKMAADAQGSNYKRAREISIEAGELSKRLYENRPAPDAANVGVECKFCSGLGYHVGDPEAAAIEDCSSCFSTGIQHNITPDIIKLANELAEKIQYPILIDKFGMEVDGKTGMEELKKTKTLNVKLLLHILSGKVKADTIKSTKGEKS